METDSIRGPRLVIDEKKCIRNIDRMVGKASENNLLFRPHFKTHQSLAIAKWFRARGVDRITVSSIKMAYYFARDGWKDILVGIAYNPREYELYEKLSDKCILQATISCPESALILAGQCRFTLEVMIKIDTGYNRSGIRWDDHASLARTMDYLGSNKRIKVRGLMTHDGSTYGLYNRQSIVDRHLLSSERINKCRDRLKMKELIVSEGDTPSASLANNFEGIDELRPGNFVFYDLMQYFNGSCGFEDIALAMICPVIDIRPASGTIVVHGGAVHLSKEKISTGGKDIYGMLVRLDNDRWHERDNQVYITSLSQEHGIINYPETAEKLSPGDLIGVIPVHSCLTADCMRGYTLTGGESIDHMQGLPQDSGFVL